MRDSRGAMAACAIAVALGLSLPRLARASAGLAVLTLLWLAWSIAGRHAV